MDNLNNHFRIQILLNELKMLFNIRSKYCLVKQNFRCIYFKINKSNMTKQTDFKCVNMKYGETRGDR